MSIIRIGCLIVAVLWALSARDGAAQTVFVRPQVTILTEPQTTVVRTPFPRRLAVRITDASGVPLSGVLVGFATDGCSPAPIQPDYCPPPEAYPRFARELDGIDPLFHAGYADFAVVYTDADGGARAPTLVAGTQPMQTFVFLYLLPQQTPWGYINLQFPPLGFGLTQVAPVPVPMTSTLGLVAFSVLSVLLGLVHLRGVGNGTGDGSRQLWDRYGTPDLCRKGADGRWGCD